MRQFFLWVKIGFAIVWLLLCFDLGVMWIRSYGISDSLSQTVVTPPNADDASSQSTEQITILALEHGEVVAARAVRYVADPQPGAGWHWTHPPYEEYDFGPSFLNHCGFSITTQQNPGFSAVRVLFPIWTVFATAILFPVIWLLRFLRKKMQPPRVASPFD